MKYIALDWGKHSALRRRTCGTTAMCFRRESSRARDCPRRQIYRTQIPSLLLSLLLCLIIAVAVVAIDIVVEIAPSGNPKKENWGS